MVVLLAMTGAAMNASSARGAGLLIADGGLGGNLDIVEHVVQVTINNGIAVTEVTQVFRNREDRPVEALYTFPVPRGASVAGFSMWINGKEMIGEVVEKKRAREIYDSYRKVRRDPGLLEQTDYKTFEMRIFPIAARAEQRVQLCYYQELDYDLDWATYVYPMATTSTGLVASTTTGRFGLTLHVKSEVPITSLSSPSHGDSFVTIRHGDSYAEASLETKAGDLNRDVVLVYQVSRPRTGIDLVASKKAGEDGYFLLTLTTGEEVAQERAGMDYVFIMDISGSMGAEGKLSLSQESVAAFINALGPEDRFEVVTFNVAATALFGALRPVTDDAKSQANVFLAQQAARGGTVLRPALSTTHQYADPTRALNVVILSDGMTEQGERAAVLDASRAKPANARIFCIGVGNDVNRPLLEQLAEEAGGLAAFVSRGDDFQRQAQAFRRKLMRRAATDLAITFDGVEVHDVEPTRLPNLFHGMPVRLYGRYRGGGPVKINVQALVDGTPTAQQVALTLPEADGGNPEIERMWAWHRVDRLLKQADRTASREPVISQIIELGETYSIATEYTSFLVLENDAEYQRWKIERRNAQRLQQDREAQQVVLTRLEAMRNTAIAKAQPGIWGAERSDAEPNAVGAPVPPPTQPGDLVFGRRHGGGPVGPLGVAGIGVLALIEWRRRRKSRPCAR